MDDTEILRILEKYSNIFSLDTIFMRIMRELLWGIVKVLGYFVDAISAITDKLFVLDRFYNDPNVIDFISSVKPLITVLFAISLLGIGYQLMFSQTKQFKKIGTNVLVAIAVILVLPMAMDRMNTLTNIGVKAVKGNPPDLTNQIIKSNIIDLMAYDEINFKDKEIKELENPNEIDVNKIRNIDATTIIEPTFFNDIGLKNKKIFTSKIVMGKKAKFDTGELNKGWFKFWEEYYYRFSINFLNIIVSLSVIGATLAFTCFKLAKLTFELGYNKFLAILIAPADIADGQKTKEIIKNIMSTFVVVFLIATLLKFYVLFVGMCTKVAGLEGVILLVAGSFAVIDGPNLVEKLFGIDAGLRSGFKTMAGAYMVGKTVMGGANKMGSTAKNMASGAGKMAGSTLGAGAGIASGLNNKKYVSLHEEMAKDKAKKTANANKEKYMYPNMAKRNENTGKKNPINSTGNSNKKNDDISSPKADTKGNGSPMYTENPSSNSLYKDNDNNTPEPINSNDGAETCGNGGNEVSGHIASNNTPEPIQHIPSNDGNGLSKQPSSNRNISNNIPESINSSKGTESSSNGGNEVSEHITPKPIQTTPSGNGNGMSGKLSSNNIPEPINHSRDNGSEASGSERNGISGHVIPNNTLEPIQRPLQSNNDNSPQQTIGQHQKQIIKEKVKNNPIVKQTVESYNRGKNTGQSIRNKNK